MKFPALNPISTQRLNTQQFIGLDKRPRTNDGAFSDMLNMSGEPWPLLSSRKKRGLVTTLENPLGIISNGGLAWIDGSSLYYEGQETPIQALSTQADMLPKRLVTMGAYILIFPDGAYYNTVNQEDWGYINREWAMGENELATFQICDMDGNIYPENKTTTSATAPEEPEEGDYWLDISESTHVLRQWRGYYESWIAIPTVYIKISAPGIGAGISVQDGVSISGVRTMGHNDSVKAQLAQLNNTHLVQAVGENYLVVIGLLDEEVEQLGGVHADRKMPKMDFVIECNNRLWGCYHGISEGETLNEIYASALGDFKNWRRYAGTSQDSYAVSVGSEGAFTGAISHRGNPYFFKENIVHKIFGEKPSNYQLQNTVCDGVKAGCENSLMAINGVLYYVSLNGVVYFETLPTSAGDALGQTWFEHGAAGEYDGLYYLSMADAEGAYSLYTLDTKRGIWHKQDGSHALQFARQGNEIYMLCSDGTLWALRGTEGEIENDFAWKADSAVMGYEYPDHKYISRFDIRMRLGPWARCDLYIEYDSSGQWEHKGSMSGAKEVRTYNMPVVPKRCDHMKIRLEGQGEVQIYSMARLLQGGSDGQTRGRVINR